MDWHGIVFTLFVALSGVFDAGETILRPTRACAWRFATGWFACRNVHQPLPHRTSTQTMGKRHPLGELGVNPRQGGGLWGVGVGVGGGVVGKGECWGGRAGEGVRGPGVFGDELGGVGVMATIPNDVASADW